MEPSYLWEFEISLNCYSLCWTLVPTYPSIPFSCKYIGNYKYHHVISKLRILLAFVIIIATILL
ncbi:hypothetical protein BDA99DRAFT_529681 [Phascolomyces articulosus]|uniref:Uncharacterized protein n=1 Tax=Phascolomyces articulosus TaxID=60185 RepID=A0AAD5P8H6_9FUNG|nr:hypothetical protein BDA99DRAFT_529681 [Phascolomyces articulosus]